MDKANVLETSRLWRETARRLAAQYPETEVEYLFVDNAAMQLIRQPAHFDVIVTENMFGDILTDEASVLGGSLGMLASASLGDGPALFEPIHGSYPQAAGRNIANPMAAILSGALLLEHFGLKEEAETIRQAVDHTIRDGFVTEDLARPGERSCTTTEVGDRIRGKDLKQRSDPEAVKVRDNGAGTEPAGNGTARTVTGPAGPENRLQIATRSTGTDY